MARRKAIVLDPTTVMQEHVDANSHHEESDTLELVGVGSFVAGTLFSLKGCHGRFKFQKYVKNERNGKEWVEAIGGIAGHKEFRAFRPDQIRRIEKR